jgi:hypothetical protein
VIVARGKKKDAQRSADPALKKGTQQPHTCQGSGGQIVDVAKPPDYLARAIARQLAERKRN